ncbi:MAG: hypothetical protein K6G12_07910 [Lachnospiraceae bacterium]|nr:hypothetical protein [Lachnospiraceae bacterium]
MNAIFEFLDKEPLENVITCLNFKIDKVIFFGYKEVIDVHKKNTEEFLKNVCGVSEVVFLHMSHDSLASCVDSMHKEIEYELGLGYDIYFDLTGGESAILVAFGMVAKDFKTPMHRFEISKNRLVELDKSSPLRISERVEQRFIHLTIEQFVKLRGVAISKKLHKDVKSIKDEEAAEDINKIWDVSRKYTEYWNPFSDILKRCMAGDGNLDVSVSGNTDGSECRCL